MTRSDFPTSLWDSTKSQREVIWHDGTKEVPTRGRYLCAFKVTPDALSSPVEWEYIVYDYYPKEDKWSSSNWCAVFDTFQKPPKNSKNVFEMKTASGAVKYKKFKSTGRVLGFYWAEIPQPT